jgi:hypothetical protein
MRAPGITVADESSVMIVRSQRDWGEECVKYTVPEYGILLCETNIAREFSNQYTDSLFIKLNGVENGCSDMDHNDLNPTDTNCRYTAVPSGNFPNLTS